MVKVKVTDLHPVSLGTTLAGTHVSHWWRQEGHPDKTANVHQIKSYLRRHARALKHGGSQRRLIRTFYLVLFTYSFTLLSLQIWKVNTFSAELEKIRCF